MCLFVCFILEREEGMEEKRKEESHRCERETSIDCLLHAPQLGTKPTTQACAPNRNGTSDLSICGTNAQPPEPHWPLQYVFYIYN